MSEAEKATEIGGRPFTPPEVADIAAEFPALEVVDLIAAGGMGAVYTQPHLLPDHQRDSRGAHLPDPRAEDSGQGLAKIRNVPGESPLPPRRTRTPTLPIKSPPSFPKSPSH